MTATDHAVELVEVAAQAAHDKKADQVLAFDAPSPSWSLAHVIVIPKVHVDTLVAPEAAAVREPVHEVIERVARRLVERFGGCRVLANVGSEQHTRHLHWHVVAGEQLSPRQARPARPPTNVTRAQPISPAQREPPPATWKRLQ